MALGVSGSLDSCVWGSLIIREYSKTRDRGTTAPPFRVRRGLAGVSDMCGTVVPGYAALGSSKGRGTPLAGRTGVAVWVLDPAPLGRDKCGLRVPRRFVVL